MQFVTDWKQKGRQEGLLQGIREGQISQGQENILRVLEVRFEEISQNLRKVVGQIDDLEVLGNLLVQAVTSQSLETFTAAAKEVIEPENLKQSPDDAQTDSTVDD